MSRPIPSLFTFYRTDAVRRGRIQRMHMYRAIGLYPIDRPTWYRPS